MGTTTFFLRFNDLKTKPGHIEFWVLVDNFGVKKDELMPKLAGRPKKM